MPPIDKIALPAEREVFDQLVASLAESKAPADALLKFDAALAKLPQPTTLRGFVQFSRAAAFDQMENHPKAIEAVEESIRLLPGYSAPLILAATTYAYANQPAKGADFLIRAAKLDPQTVRAIDDYEVDNILRRLSEVRDERRAFALSDQLLAADWVGSRLGSRSRLARLAIERRARDGDLAGARALVPKLLVPGHTYSLLMSRDYSPLWDGIERWAGPKLERQWALYIEEARARWAASKSIDTVGDYLGALSAAGHYDTIIRDILPLYSGKIDQDGDVDLIFALHGVAEALARKGRWADVDALYDRAQKIWPLTWSANAINIAANRGKYQLLAGRPADALRYLDESIAQGARWDVNPGAVAGMHQYRACALHQLGRPAEAAKSITLGLIMGDSSAAVSTHLCVGNHKAARQALLDGLKDPVARDSSIAFFQKTGPELAGDYSRRIRQGAEALRADPELRAEMLKYGRILPFYAREGAPPEQMAAEPAPPSDAPEVSDRSDKSFEGSS